MWKYIVYWTVATTVSISCPDMEYGYDCGKKHEKTTTDSHKAEFVHKEHAISFMVRQKERGYKIIELDSIIEGSITYPGDFNLIQHGLLTPTYNDTKPN